MAVVLGDPTNLHLVEIRHSSVAPVLHAPKAIALEAESEPLGCPGGTAPSVKSTHTIE